MTYPLGWVPLQHVVRRLTSLGLTCGSNMPTGGCEVQAERLRTLDAYRVSSKPLLRGVHSQVKCNKPPMAVFWTKRGELATSEPS